MASKFDCEICASQGLTTSVKRNAPTTCATAHKANEYACSQCWEAHLSLEVERKHPSKVECMFCTSTVGEKEIERLARVATVRRYRALLDRLTSAQCIRRCLAGYKDGRFVESPRQPHNRETSGSVFTCSSPDCRYKYCLDCERPDHPGETCAERKARVELMSQYKYNPKTGRVVPSHAEAYAMTKKVFIMCPGCGVCGEVKGGCGYVECKETSDKEKNNGYGCNFRFCQSKGCLIDWVGESSAYLGGPTSHRGKCKYINRAWPSEHTLTHRFEETDPKKMAVLAARAAKKDQKAADRKVSTKPVSAPATEIDAAREQTNKRKFIDEASEQAVHAPPTKRSKKHGCVDALVIKAAKRPKQPST